MVKAVKEQGRGNLLIKCPACKLHHMIHTEESPNGQKWKFNGDFDKPTFSPSVSIKTGHYVAGQPQPPDCHLCNYEDESGEDWPWPCGICHFFVRDGKIQFLNDCSHALAGKTLDLEDF